MKKNIILKHGYYLTVGSKDVALMRETKPKDSSKTPESTYAGFYSTFGGAIQGYKRRIINQKLSEQDSIELKEAIAIVKELEEETRQLILSTGLDAGIDIFV